jgi:5-methylcytosine-specific restriction endonuclease McrA
MAWENSPEKRARDAEHYRHPEYVRNRPLALRRANGRCEKCGRRARLQVDHKTPLAILVDHSLANLWGLCGTCHSAKTAADSHAARQAKRPAPRPRTQW